MKRGTNPRRNHQAGGALLTALFFSLVITLVGAGILSLASTSSRITYANSNRVKNLYVAVAGAEHAKEYLNHCYKTKNGVTDSAIAMMDSPDFEGYEFVKTTGAPGIELQKVGENELRVVETGNYVGLNSVAQNFLITSTVQDTFDDLAQVLEDVYLHSIPMAQFAVFYDQDLEMLPGPDMIIEGRVHTNGDMYVGTHNTFSMESYVTAVGGIYHQRKDDPSAIMAGTVRIKDSAGNYQNLGSMSDPDNDLDSDHPDWAEESQTRWGGRVRSEDHNVPPLTLPLETGEDPHDIIERANVDDSDSLKAMKFENKADLKIINGVGYDKTGNVVDLTYPDPANPTQRKSVISTKTFFNFRENKTIVSRDIDIGNLLESGINMGDGVLYVSDTQPGGSQQSAVRVKNGKKLPSQGLTVATDNPIYVWGDYNTTNKVKALIAGDAVNILSNDWKDTNTTYNSRTVTNQTSVNTVVMTGNTETVVGQYNGGLENNFRFLEKWEGKKLQYRGSIIDLWKSEIAKGNWLYGSPHYTAPTRDWRFDQMYLDPLNSPPGIPVLYTIERIEFAHHY